jgi:hypothetical protein
MEEALAWFGVFVVYGITIYSVYKLLNKDKTFGGRPTKRGGWKR